MSDINDLDLKDELKKNIFSLLKEEVSIDKIKPILHVPICLLHECSITKNATVIDDEYKNAIIAQYTDVATRYFREQLDACKRKIYLYSKIVFHLILFPVPSKKEIVDEFITTAKFYRR